MCCSLFPGFTPTGLSSYVRVRYFYLSACYILLLLIASAAPLDFLQAEPDPNHVFFFLLKMSFFLT